MARPNHEVIRRMQDRYIDHKEEDDVILVDDIDEYCSYDIKNVDDEPYHLYGAQNSSHAKTNKASKK